MFDGLRDRSARMGAGASEFYRANRGLVLGGITIFSILLIVWARMGFSFEVGRFFAAAPEVCTFEKKGDPECACAQNRGKDSACHVCTKSFQEGNTDYSDAQWFAWDNLKLCDPNCPAKYPYRTERTKKGGGSWSGDESCVEKPPDCPEGYHALGGSLCEADAAPAPSTAPTTAPAPTAAATPLPAVLSVVCGATSNVLTWVTPLPTGSNASAINKNATPPGGTTVSTQIGIDLGANPSSYTDTAVQAGYSYSYAFKNHVSVRSNDVACPQGATTSTAPTDPNAPAPGELKAVCTGGTSPSITVRWSKSPPAGSTGALNEGNPAVLNRTVPPAAAEQLNPPVTDKTTYWEWVDAGVPSGSTVTYRGKYGPNVSTNSLSLNATPSNCGVVAALVCAPLTQNVAVNQQASLQSSGSGANDQVQWFVDGQVKSGSATTFVFTEAGTKTVTVRAGTQSATCTVVVGSQTSTEALSFTFAGRNSSTGGAEGPTVSALPNQEVEFIGTVRNNSAGNLTNVIVQSGMPSTITYVQGSTTVNGTPTSVNSVTVGGLSVGAMGAGQQTVVRWRGRLSATGFPVGQSQAVVSGSASADGQSARSGQVTVLVNRTTGAATAQTGPGEAVLAALLVSAVVTLLYVSYTHGPAYRRHEVESLGKGRDPLDFRS